MTAGAMIVLDRLTKRFGNLLAVDGVSLSVGSGEVLGFLGPNGAGKSTTMKMIAGFLAPSAGSATVCGFNVADDPVAVKTAIGYLPEGAPAYGEMTPAGFLNFVAAIRGFDGAERQKRVDAAVERIELGEVLEQPIETLSKGFKRRVGLAQAILHDPGVLILDEPTDGLDPNQKHQVRTLIRDMAADKAIIISTHILEEVDAVCSRAVVIAHGRLLADASPGELHARAQRHNAVTLTVPAASAAGLMASLGGIKGVRGIDALDSADGGQRFRVLAVPGSSIAAEVAALLSRGGVETRELTVEQGSLDEVFRDLTLGDTGAPPNSAPETAHA